MATAAETTTTTGGAEGAEAAPWRERMGSVTLHENCTRVAKAILHVAAALRTRLRGSPAERILRRRRRRRRYDVRQLTLAPRSVGDCRRGKPRIEWPRIERLQQGLAGAFLRRDKQEQRGGQHRCSSDQHTRQTSAASRRAGSASTALGRKRFSASLRRRARVARSIQVRARRFVTSRSALTQAPVDSKL